MYADDVFSVQDEKSFSLYYNIFRKALKTASNFSSNSSSSNESSVLLLVNDDEDWMPEESREMFKFIVEGLGITIITTIGIIGNILTIFVLARKMYYKSINLFLLGLTISDTIFIFCAMLVFGIPNICIYMDIDITKSYLGRILPYSLPIGFSALTTSVYFTVAVTVERYLAVSFPLQARVHCTPQNAKYCGFGILLFAFLLNLPRWLEYTCVVIHKEDDSFRYLTVTTSLRRNPIYDKYYILIGFSTFAFVLPIVVLLVLNLLIYHNVKMANRNRKSLSKSQKSENSLAFMLIIIVTIFICCNSVSLLDALVKSITKSRNHNLESFRNFFVIFNSSVNFFIYCAYGEVFRGMFLDMLPKWIKTRCCCCLNVKVEYRSDSLIIRRVSSKPNVNVSLREQSLTA